MSTMSAEDLHQADPLEKALQQLAELQKLTPHDTASLNEEYERNLLFFLSHVFTKLESPDFVPMILGDFETNEQIISYFEGSPGNGIALIRNPKLLEIPAAKICYVRSSGTPDPGQAQSFVDMILQNPSNHRWQNPGWFFKRDDHSYPYEAIKILSPKDFIAFPSLIDPFLKGLNTFLERTVKTGTTINTQKQNLLLRLIQTNRLITDS